MHVFKAENNLATGLRREKHGFRLMILMSSWRKILQASSSHLSSVEPHLAFREYPVLRQVIVKIATVHQIEDETQLIGGLWNTFFMRIQ